jgi:hypothetical protein
VSDTTSQAAVRKFLRDEFRREQESNFALLRRIPSTDVRKFLDYFLALNKSDQSALAEGLAQHALVSFFSSMPNAFEASNAAFRQYLDAKCQMSGWKYTSVPAMRSMLAVAKQDPNSQTANYLTKKMREQIDAIKPVKSTEIRKVIKLALSQLFVPLTVKRGGWVAWNYCGIHQGNEVCVSIDTGSRSRQLEYGVSVEHKKHGIMFGGLGCLNYERVMGLSFAWWDCLERSNLDQSIALLKDLVIYCAEIPNRLPAEYKHDKKI